MGYSVKWVTDNLGITRDMLRYYEGKELLPKNKDRQYRNYSDIDIEKIWGIKLLIKIGFTADEIKLLMTDPNFDFDSAIAKKVAELQESYDEKRLYLEFAKTIKLTGLIPTVSNLGDTKFDKFLAYALKNWNIYDDPYFAPFAKLSDTLLEKTPSQNNAKGADQIQELLDNTDSEMVQYCVALEGYFQVISDMQEFGYTSDMVQTVVALMLNYFIIHAPYSYFEKDIMPQAISKHLALNILGGNTAVLYKQRFGEDGLIFIVKAIAYYGGYNIYDL